MCGTENIRHWIDRHLEGDPQAFEQIYERTSLNVYRLVYFLLGREEEADDVVQDVYVQLFRNFHKYDRERPFEKWLNGIAVRQVGDYRRKRWKLTRLLMKARRFEGPEGAGDFAGEVVDNVANEQLLRQIQTLPQKLRTVVVLHYWNECTHAEIADMLDVPVGTVKSRLHAGLAKLRQKQAFRNLSMAKEAKGEWI